MLKDPKWDRLPERPRKRRQGFDFTTYRGGKLWWPEAKTWVYWVASMGRYVTIPKD